MSVGAGGDDAERLGLKWAHPVQDVDVLDTGTSPTLSRVLAQGTLLLQLFFLTIDFLKISDKYFFFCYVNQNGRRYDAFIILNTSRRAYGKITTLEG